MPDTTTIRAFLDPHHLELADQVQAFAAAEIAPLEPRHDDDGARAQALRILRLLGRAGLVGHAIPEAWGGLPGAPDLRACCLIRETLAAASPLADSVYALQCLGSMPISLAGSDEQQRRYLPAVAAGEMMAALSMVAMARVGPPAASLQRLAVAGRSWPRGRRVTDSGAELTPTPPGTRAPGTSR